MTNSIDLFIGSNGIRRNAAVECHMARERSRNNEAFASNTPAISRFAILMTAQKHATQIMKGKEVLNLQRSQQIVVALQPSVQEIKEELMYELNYVRKLKGNSSFNISEYRDSLNSANGVTLCDLCKCDMINIYFACTDCQGSMLCCKCINDRHQEEVEYYSGQNKLLHKPGEKEHCSFNVKFRHYLTLDKDTIFQKVEKASFTISQSS